MVFNKKLLLKCTLITVVFAFSVMVLLQELKFKKVTASSSVNKMENLIYLKLKDGVVVIETLPEIAPNHVSRIKYLIRKGFYNDNTFFRVIDGFVAQTGDPTGTGRGGSGKNLKPEFSKVSHKRGVVSMARANNPESADSQFFIVLQDSEFLDEKYTVWGRVISGMEFVDNIKKAKTGSNGIVENPDRILSMALAIDVKNFVDKDLKKLNK